MIYLREVLGDVAAVSWHPTCWQQHKVTGTQLLECNNYVLLHQNRYRLSSGSSPSPFVLVTTEILAMCPHMWVQITTIPPCCVW